MREKIETSITYKYWGMVVGIAWKSAWERAEMRGLRLVLSGVIVTLVATYVLHKAGIIDVAYLRDTVLGTGIGLVAQVCCPLAVLMGAFIAFTSSIPPKLYRKQGGFIENPFEITLVSYQKYAKTNEKWVGLQVGNKTKSANIEDCRLTLVSVANLQTNVFTVFDAPIRLVWSGINVNNSGEVPEYLTIQHKDPKPCDVAVTMSDLHNARFTTWFARGSELLTIVPGNYRLVVRASGMWDSQPISYDYVVDLSFQPDYDLKIEQVSEEANAS